MPILSRRAFVAGATLAGVSPFLTQPLPSNPNVVIVSAGAAGRATSRVGGRPWTKNTSFGQPVDHGCSWVSGSNDTPFTRYGQAGEFTRMNGACLSGKSVTRTIA